MPDTNESYEIWEARQRLDYLEKHPVPAPLRIMDVLRISSSEAKELHQHLLLQRKAERLECLEVLEKERPKFQRLMMGDQLARDRKAGWR